MEVIARYTTAWAILVQAVFLCAASAQTGAIAYVADGSSVRLVEVASGESKEIAKGENVGGLIWSPTGEWVAFESNVGESRVVCIVKHDGTDLRVVSRMDEWNRYPAWSPDGRKLVFSAGADPRDMRLVTYHIGKDEETEWGGPKARGLTKPYWLGLATLGTIMGAAQGTAWGESLDLEKLERSVMFNGGMIMAVQLRRGGKGLTTDIALTTYDDMLPPASEMIFPSPGDYVEWNLLPSPEGRAIAYESNDGGDREIYLFPFLRAAYDLTNHYADDWNPVWSPDSESVVFESFRSGRRGVYRVIVDTIRIWPLGVDEDADCWSPTWSPDSAWVAYVRGDEDASDIVIVDKLGNDARAVVDDGRVNTSPAWRPEPEE